MSAQTVDAAYERDLAVEELRCAFDELSASVLFDDDRHGRIHILERLSHALERLGAHPALDEHEGHRGPMPDVSDWERVDRERQVDEEQERDKIRIRERSW